VISDVPGELPPIVAATDGDLVVFGSSVLTKTLLQHRLVDQLVLLLFPLVLGSGKRMFTDDTRSEFRLTAAETSGTGVAILRYELDR
jgi:dihydrofolate reductase